MKIVLDTNVLVSAAFWDGPEWRLVEECLRGTHEMIVSKAIVVELQRVLAEKFAIGEVDVQMYLLALLHSAEYVQPKNEINVIKTDPSDNRILETAVAGHAELIVTGDRHLLELKEFQGIPIRRAAHCFS